MLRLPMFDVVSPETIDEAIEALALPGARLVAGGTDLLPNLKHRLHAPPRLVSLTRVRELAGITRLDSELRIGAATTLAELAKNEAVLTHFESLAQAAGLVAGPQIRNTATIGGNVNLDTRCRWVNQTAFWRGALGGCLKADGDVCHVVEKGRRCVAALSSDTVPVLISLGASFVLRGPGGERILPAAKYYTADGLRHTVREDDELMTQIRLPIPEGRTAATYVKWRVRGSIDFPLVSVALRFDLDEAGVIEDLSVVAGVLGAKPRLVRKLEAVIGQKLADPSVARQIADAAHAQCKPLENVPYEAPHRRHLIGVLTRRAVESLGGRDPAS